MARSSRLFLTLATIASLWLCAPAAAKTNTKDSTLVPGPSEAAAQKLAHRYAPIAMLREEQDPPCEKTAEQYQPTSVGTVLGNPTVTLAHEALGDPGAKLEDVKRAPTAADIAGLPDGYYLDLEGEVLGETCIYAKAFAKLLKEGRAPAVTYAHIAREPNHSGFALQYWFFWYFNQFNDLHEGDWEGMQLSFEANTTSAALNEEPSEIILFQHAGGERASWTDAKVKKDGTRPIVYPAAGSHATFYDSAVYIENGQEGSGVGCDNTSEPLRELPLRPVLLPETAPEQGPFKWLTYDGRWGEREKGFNNGPTGPPTKTVWKEPFAWMADQRTTSPRLPGGSIAGPQITGVFCGAVTSVTDFINLEAQSRVAAVATLLGLALLIGLFVGLTRWGPVDLTSLRAERAFGQLLRTARQLYGRHWRVLVAIALAGLVIIGGTNVLASLLAGGSGADEAAGRSGVNLALADLVESIARPIALAVVAAIVVIFMRLLVESEPAGFRACWDGMRERFWRILGALLLATLGISLLFLSIIGIPFAIWKLVGWSFVGQEVLFTDKSLRESFRGSSSLVRGRWWHAVRVVVFLVALLFIAGPVLTLGLIFTPLPLLAINLLGALIFSLLIPYAAIAQTLLYFDLQARAEEGRFSERETARLQRLAPRPSPGGEAG
ncbi:MAG TPA: hypothetical protein VFI03_05930 [Solirubrobacterales bacterium]|nr:hypothetical protein [Solirubrobacterales bacterium]